MALLAWALAGPVGELKTSLGQGVWVNWTQMTVQVVVTGQGGGVGGRQPALEQRLRTALAETLVRALDRVPVQRGVTVRDLRVNASLNAVLSDRVKLWTVTEARYFASGRLTLVGEIALGEYLLPWRLEQAWEQSPMPIASQYTGLIVDARGHGLSPVFAPKLFTQQGKVVYPGELWSTQVLRSVPVVYVTDLAHPASARAGDNPLTVTLAEGSGADGVLDVPSAQTFAEQVRGSVWIGMGTVVILVDP